MARVRVSTFAGGAAGDQALDGKAGEAAFEAPAALATCPTGNVYVADGRRVRCVTKGGDVTTITECKERVAGIAASGEQLFYSSGPQLSILDLTQGGLYEHSLPEGSGALGRLAVDSSGNVYTTMNDAILVFTGDDRGAPVQRFVGGHSGRSDGYGHEAGFRDPVGLTIGFGCLYVADSGNGGIREVSPDGHVETVSGKRWETKVSIRDGLMQQAAFTGLGGLALDDRGNLFVCESSLHRVRKISFSGDDLVAALRATSASVLGPHLIKIVNGYSACVYVSTIVGFGGRGCKDGAGSEAQFDTPTDIAFCSDGSLLVTDCGNRRIRRIQFEAEDATAAAAGEQQDWKAAQTDLGDKDLQFRGKKS